MEQPLKNTKFAARNYGTTANSAEFHAANAANAADPANTADKVANAAEATNSAELLATKATKATNAIDTADRPYKRFKMANSFQELGLNSYLIKAISELGFEKPTPVQERIIPDLLSQDNDIVCLAQTGTGTRLFSLNTCIARSTARSPHFSRTAAMLS